MTVTHVGSSKSYVAGWDHIFAKGAKKSGGKSSAKKKSGSKPKRGKKKS